MFKVTALALLVAQATSTLAHGGVTSFSIGGVKYQGWQPFIQAAGQVTAGRPYTSYDPILDPIGSTLHCNNAGESGPSQQTLNITGEPCVYAPGNEITAYWAQWTHAEGPVTVYLAGCPSSGCTGVDSSSVSWFKIAEQGLINGTVGKGSWANGILMKELAWTTKIPSSLKAGPYLIRWETLALHQSNTPQFYPECAQLQVAGAGSTFPTSEYLVKIPGAWKASDPGVTIDIYGSAAQTQTNYTIPGPRIYPGFS